MTAKKQSKGTRSDMEAQGQDAPSYVYQRRSRDEILSEAIRGLRADLTKVMEARSN